MGFLSAFKKADKPAPAAPLETVPDAPVAPRIRRRRLLLLSADSASRQELRQMFQAMQLRWDVAVEPLGENGLDPLEKEAFDAVVVDAGVPAGQETKVLNTIAHNHPRVLRFLRCASDQKDMAKRCGAPAPTTLSKDADPEAIFSAIDRAFKLDQWMMEDGVKDLISRIPRLPSLPALYSQVMNELKSPEGSIEVVACLISKDPVMTAKILQVVNSAFFSLPREICDPKEAVMFLGAERTKSLVLLAKVFSQFEQSKCAGFSMEAMWRHSMAVAGYAQRLCQSLKKEAKMAEAAFTAGLLHDIGKLLLAGNLPDQYHVLVTQAQRRGLPVGEVEREIFGTGHAEVGACLLGIWGLPLQILEAIAYHHRPSDSEDRSFTLLTAVHAANVFDHESRGQAKGFRPIDADYLERLGLREERNPWRQACGLRCRADENPLVEKLGAKVKVA